MTTAGLAQPGSLLLEATLMSDGTENRRSGTARKVQAVPQAFNHKRDRRQDGGTMRTKNIARRQGRKNDSGGGLAGRRHFSNPSSAANTLRRPSTNDS